ncbi:type II and III secretion system protein [Opitutales bacterium]|nr:type II and III secretion system protein [Opitutales bacterium]
MKKYLAARKCASAILLAGALGTFTFVVPQAADAQNASEKIQLMAETLRARDSGDLALAKEKAEELIKVAPQDQNVQRILASINKDLDREQDGNSIYGQASTASVEEAMINAPEAVEVNEEAAVEATEAPAEEAANEAESIVAAAAADQDAKLAAAENAIDEADKLAELGAYTDATNLLNAAAASLTLNTSTADVLDDIDAAKADVVLTEAKALAAAGDAKAAEALLEEYRAAGGRSKAANALAASLDKQISNPYELAIQDISPEYVAQSKIVRDLLTRGRAQYLNGDYDGAAATFKEVEARDANNPEAKLFQTRIAEILGGIHAQNQYKTREQMLTEVDQGWERPKVFDVSTGSEIADAGDSSTQRKLSSIIIPQVNFSGMELTRVIETLSELSVEYDPERVGVNIVVLFNREQSNPRVNISLRNLNLDRILQFVTQQVNFAYDVGADAVTVAPSDGLDGTSNTITEFFPISRATVIRLTGFRDVGGSGSASVDPFAAPSASSSSGPSASEEVEALQAFFQSAGVNFDLPGASLAFDGEQLIITQSRRNLERMRVILRNYNEVKQVEIESKFLEVQQGDLDELGFDWNVSKDGTTIFEFAPRSLSDAFGVATDGSSIQISSPKVDIFDNGGQVIGGIAEVDVKVPSPPPSLPNNVDLGTNGLSVSSVVKTFGLGAYDADFALRALSRKTGSDLMSAPKVTVLSGKRATITVAQEMRYPESYGDIESTVSSGGGSNGSTGGGGISITAGTPQDFVTRNVGVEMTVTPNVENDDTISLILEPRVTEFEGFVEYGGPSVALQGGTTVTVPAGFYQPIFSTREITTEVTVYDGATVVMGGLTRDEVKTVNDKVPVLGDVPGLGRLFRSEGETRLKRNLLIFVTANLVSPGGSPSRQNYRNVNANSLFQNPTIMTPSGAVNRSIDPGVE